jgi:hypothetical protein
MAWYEVMVPMSTFTTYRRWARRSACSPFHCPGGCAAAGRLAAPPKRAAFRLLIKIWHLAARLSACSSGMKSVADLARAVTCRKLAASSDAEHQQKTRACSN